jgi:hypothetical protein
MTDGAQPHGGRPWYKRPVVWIVFVVLAVLLVAGLMEMGKSPATIRYSDFLDQLDAGNVASVTFAGTRIDGRFKAPVTETASGAALTAFRSRVPDFGDPSLFPELRGRHVTIGVASSQWFGLGVGGTAILGVIAAFLLAKPMLLVIAAAFIAGLVRVARGGKMDIHSILSMMPMFRSVSDQSAKEKKSNGASPRVGD